MPDLQRDPIGTPHPKARCGWCGGPLVVAAVIELRCWLCANESCWKRQVARALLVAQKGKARVCLNVPLPSQIAFEEAQARNILWGGQAGPGKSHGVRWWLYQRSLLIPNHKAVLLRENSKQLETTHLFDMRRELPLFDAKLVEDVARFPNGSEIHCGHMAEAAAVQRYLGTEYGAIVADEGSLYPVDAQGVTTLAELSTRARKDFLDVNGTVVPPRFIVVTNPGGPSAPWLSEMFIHHQPDFEKFPKLREHYDPQEWAYVPAKLSENPYMRDDYASTTLAVLHGVRYRQLAEGDWDVFVGQFFGEWHEADHVKTFRIAAGTEHFVSMDWGRLAPGCALWWACLPDGHYHVRHEWKFQGMEADEVAREILKQTKAMGLGKLRYVAADPSMWNKSGDATVVKGESKAETMIRIGLPMRKGDNDRLNGWSRCALLLRSPAEGEPPRFTVDPSCRYLRRTIPAAVSDSTNAEDVDTTIDDHGLDAWRYGAMSRPSPTRIVEPKKPKGSAGRLLDELVTELRVA